MTHVISSSVDRFSDCGSAGAVCPKTSASSPRLVCRDDNRISLPICDGSTGHTSGDGAENGMMGEMACDTAPAAPRRQLRA